MTTNDCGMTTLQVVVGDDDATSTIEIFMFFGGIRIFESLLFYLEEPIGYPAQPGLILSVR